MADRVKTHLPNATNQGPATVREQLERIVTSSHFEGAARQQAFLRFVVSEFLAGRANEIKETLVAISVYDKPPDYDPRLDSTVRVEASKLRQRLENYYQHAGKSDRVRISIPKGSYQPQILTAPIAPESAAFTPFRRPGLWAMAAATASCFALALGWWWGSLSGVAHSRIVLTRLSEPNTFSGAPAISPGGEYIVYSSNRENDHALNLWRQQLSSGPDVSSPVRLTRSHASHETPTISADGRTIVFRSNENGGSLMGMSLPQMDPRGIGETIGGRNPRFCPTGPALAYWVPQDEHTVDYGQVFVDAMDGSGRVRLFGDFAHAAFPIWSDNGRRILALGTWHSNIPEKEFDAWTIELDGIHSRGSPKKLGLFPALEAAGLLQNQAWRSRVEIADWLGDWLYVTLPVGENMELFRVRLNKDAQSVSGLPERLTFGAGDVSSPRVARDGRIVFARTDLTYNLFSLRVPHGQVLADDLQRHTSETASHFRPFVRPNGFEGVWERLRVNSNHQVWLFNLITGAQRKIAGDNSHSYTHALVSPDGLSSVFRMSDPGFQPIYRQALAGGQATRICDNCGTPSDFAPNGRHLFYVTGGEPANIGLLDTSTGEHRDILRHPSHSLFGARAWLNAQGDGSLAFYADTGRRTHQVFVAPFRGFQPGPLASWTAVTDGAHWDQSPAWAPDGRTLFYVSRHDGFACIMARSMDPNSGVPRGPSWAVQHFHSPSQTFMTTMHRRGVDALTVTPERIFFSLDNRRSELWKISGLDRTR